MSWFCCDSKKIIKKTVAGMYLFHELQQKQNTIYKLTKTPLHLLMAIKSSRNHLVKSQLQSYEKI